MGERIEINALIMKKLPKDQINNCRAPPLPPYLPPKDTPEMKMIVIPWRTTTSIPISTTTRKIFIHDGGIEPSQVKEIGWVKRTKYRRMNNECHLHRSQSSPFLVLLPNQPSLYTKMRARNISRKNPISFPSSSFLFFNLLFSISADIKIWESPERVFLGIPIHYPHPP